MDALKIVSTISCPAVEFTRFWKTDGRVTEYDTLYMFSREQVVNLTTYVQYLSKPLLVELLGYIVQDIEENALPEAYLQALDRFLHEEEFIHVWEQMEYIDWKPIAKHFGLKLHHSSPDTEVQPYRQLKDIFGVYEYDSYIHVGLNLRSSQLRQVKYLPLTDVREPTMLYYAKEALSLNDILEYCRIGMHLEGGKSLIVHELLETVGKEDISRFITNCLKATLLMSRHSYIDAMHAYKDSDIITVGLYKLRASHENEMEYLCSVFEVEVPTFYPETTEDEFEYALEEFTKNCESISEAKEALKRHESSIVFMHTSVQIWESRPEVVIRQYTYDAILETDSVRRVFDKIVGDSH